MTSFTEDMDTIKSSISELQSEVKGQKSKSASSDVTVSLDSIKSSLLQLQSDFIDHKNAANSSVSKTMSSDSTTSTEIVPEPRRSKRIQLKNIDKQIEVPVSGHTGNSIIDVTKNINHIQCNFTSVQKEDVTPTKMHTADYHIRVVHPRRWLFVTRVHHSVPEEHFHKLLNKVTSTDDYFVQKIIPKSSSGLNYDYVSYKINLPEEPFQAAINSKLWPDGLLVKEFEWNQKKPFFQKLRLSHQPR